MAAGLEKALTALSTMASVFPWWRRPALSLTDKGIFFFTLLHGQHFFPRLIEIYEPWPWGQSPEYGRCSCYSRAVRASSSGKRPAPPLSHL